MLKFVCIAWPELYCHLVFCLIVIHVSDDLNCTTILQQYNIIIVLLMLTLQYFYCSIKVLLLCCYKVLLGCVVAVPLCGGMSQVSSPHDDNLSRIHQQTAILASSSSPVLRGSSIASLSPSDTVRSSLAAVVPGRTVIVGGFGSVESSVRGVNPASRLSMQPAFIETDFTVPLVNAPGQGRQVAHHHYQRDIKTLSSQCSSSRPSPLTAAVSPSAAVSPAVPLLSPGAIISRGPSPSNTASLLSNHSKVLTVPQLHRTHSRSPGVFSGDVCVNEYGKSIPRSHISRSPSSGRLPVHSVVHIANASRHLGREGGSRHVIIEPLSRQVGDVVSRALPVSAHQAQYGGSRSSLAEVQKGLASPRRLSGQHLSAAHQRHHNDVIPVFESHRLASVAQHRSANLHGVQLSRSNSQFQIQESALNGSRLVPVEDLSTSAPLSAVSPLSSMSGYCVIQQPKKQSHQSRSKMSMAESLLRPALMRMAAINPEVNVAFKSSASSSQGAANLSTVSDWTSSGGFSSARQCVSHVSDITSHYRTIQPKPMDMASSYANPSGLRVVSTSSILRQSSLLSPAVSSVVSDRTSKSVGSRQLHSASPMTSSQRSISGVSLRPQSSLLNVPRVPAAAHVFPKTKFLPASPLPPPPPYIHRVPLISPPITLPRSSANGHSKTETISEAPLSISSSLCSTLSRSSMPHCRVDSFDSVPLDCSRKTNLVDNNTDGNYVLNLTTSGNTSRLDMLQSEVIDLSGGGSNSQNVEHSYHNHSQRSTTDNNVELEDLSVAKKQFGYDGVTGVRGREDVKKIEPVIGGSTKQITTASSYKVKVEDEVKVRDQLQENGISGGLAAALGINEYVHQKNTVRDIDGVKNNQSCRNILTIDDVFNDTVEKCVDSPAGNE